jgi:hypothetical protein
MCALSPAKQPSIKSQPVSLSPHTFFPPLHCHVFWRCQSLFLRVSFRVGNLYQLVSTSLTLQDLFASAAQPRSRLRLLLFDPASHLCSRDGWHQHLRLALGQSNFSKSTCTDIVKPRSYLARRYRKVDTAGTHLRLIRACQGAHNTPTSSAHGDVQPAPHGWFEAAPLATPVFRGRIPQ